MTRGDDTPETYLCDRELAWLRFDRRVLEEAADPSVPLLERLRFVAIFSSNLDEFFRVRVAWLLRLARLKPQLPSPVTGHTARQRLREVLDAIPPLYQERDKLFARLEPQLERLGVKRFHPAQLPHGELRRLERYFQRQVAPILSPLVIDRHHPFPHLPDKQLWAALSLRRGRKERLALIPVPSALPACISLGEGRYVLTPALLLHYAHLLFPRDSVTSRAIIAVTRSADMELDGHDDPDLRRQIEQSVKQRQWLAPVRLEVEGALKKETLDALRFRLGLSRRQVFCSASPLSLGYLDALAQLSPQADSEQYIPFTPAWPRDLDPGKPILPQLLRRDVLLYYPYHSMEPFLRLIREAAWDKAVVSIKITIYRLGDHSRLAEYLAQAAERGKEVTVLLELRARFDEQNNIRWAKRLETAGCTLLYGEEGQKVHAKVCLITRRERGRVQTITQLGTGNYNETTARLYSDLCLITAHPGIGADAGRFFQALATAAPQGRYRYLLPAPQPLLSALRSLIHREARKGADGFIFCKANMLDSPVIIEDLLAAARAGAHILLNIRGGGCLLPRVPGVTDNVRVFSVVGRFLEHARIYVFGKGDDADIYLSSADLMTRNLERRVELACPVLDPALRRRVAHYVEVLCHDAKKARDIAPDGSWRAIPPRAGRPALDAQQQLLAEIKKEEGDMPSSK